MTAEQQVFDIAGIPELVQVVDEVQKTQRACILRRDDQDVAVLSPLPVKRARRSRRQNNVLLQLLAIADSGDARSTGPTDVSSNKHFYLAEALAAECSSADDA